MWDNIKITLKYWYTRTRCKLGWHFWELELKEERGFRFPFIRYKFKCKYCCSTKEDYINLA